MTVKFLLTALHKNATFSRMCQRLFLVKTSKETSFLVWQWYGEAITLLFSMVGSWKFKASTCSCPFFAPSCGQMNIQAIKSFHLSLLASSGNLVSPDPPKTQSWGGAFQHSRAVEAEIQRAFLPPLQTQPPATQ